MASYIATNELVCGIRTTSEVGANMPHLIRCPIWRYIEHQGQQQHVGYSPFLPLLSSPNYSKLYTRRAGYSNLQSLYIYVSRHTSGRSPNLSDGCTYTNWKSSLLLLPPSRSPNENRWLTLINVHKRLFDSMVAPILDYRVPAWCRFCSLGTFLESVAIQTSAGSCIWRHQHMQT